MHVLSRMHGALYPEHVLCGAKAHIPISQDLAPKKSLRTCRWPTYLGVTEKSGPTLGAPTEVAMERAPFFPTERTAKKWLSVETSFSVVSPAEVVKS